MKWLKNNKEFWAAMMVGVLFACYANAGSLYSWSNGEVLTATQLNANFNHIHNNMVGGHGARLVDADVSASAAIQQTKISSYHLFPVAWAYVSATCTAGTCTLGDSSGVTSITFVSTGVYTVTWTTSMGDSNYAVLPSSGTADVLCYTSNVGATTATVTCRTAAEGTAAGVANAAFSLVAFDNN